MEKVILTLSGQLRPDAAISSLINGYSYDISARAYWREKYLAIYIGDKPTGAIQLDEAKIIFFHSDYI